MKCALFVDAANMFYAQRDNKWHMDYKRVYEYFSKDKDVFDAYYFTGTPSFEKADKIQEYRKFKRSLIYVGYTVIDKEIKIMKNGQRKCNLDVEITLHMTASVNNYDIFYFMSGDSDFAPLIKYLRENGKQVVCIARKQSTSLEMVNIANKFIDISDIKSAIEKKKKQKKGAHI